MRTDRSWYPTPADLDWIESISPPVIPALAAIEAAAEPLRVPIVDRDAGRALRVLAAGRRRIVEFGTAYGYSTLWMALGQPADGTIVTLDPGPHPDRSGPWLVARGRHRRRAHRRRQRAGTGRLRRLAIRRSPDPFDLVFIDALKHEYGAYVEAVADRLVPGALIVADNVLWSGRVSGVSPTVAGRRGHQRPARVRCGDAERPADDRDDPAGRGWAARRHLARLRSSEAAVHVRVRLFAIQREQVGERHVELELAEGATVG